MAYITIFAASVPTDRRADYTRLVEEMASIHKEHGALSVTECWGADVPDGKLTSFPMAVQSAEGETVVIGWIEWPSKEASDTGSGKIMEDPRMKALFTEMPIDGKRLIFGGFEQILKI